MPNKTQSDALPIPDIAYEKFVLDNGLTLLVHEDRKTPIVAVNVWYHVGSKNEKAGRTGFAHLFEHLMFNGSENFNDEFFRPLEQVGATGMNGTTNADRTNYFANVPTPSLDTLLWLESDRMGHLLGAIDQAKLDEQRGVVQNEKRQGENRPYGKVWDLIPQYSYPQGHPYSWTTIGSMQDLDAASLDDVKQWFQEWYGAANAVVVIAGDIDAQTAKAKVEEYFADIPAGPRLNRPQTWPAPMTADRFVSLQDDVPQARSYLVWNVAPNYSQDLVHLQTAADILANGKTSRLYQRLVHQEQLATGVGAFVSPREMGSQFMVYVTARPDQNIAPLEQIVREEIQRLMEAGPQADELERSRTGLFVGMLRGMEKVGGFGGKSDLLASSHVLTGRADAWKDELQWLRDATPKSVQNSMQTWLQHGHLTVRVEPQARHSTRASTVDRSQLPASGVAKSLQLPELQRAQLSNGMNVVLLERHELPLVDVRLLSQAGYAADPKDRPGLANVSMSMLDEGTQKRDALALATRLDELGASVDAGASLDTLSVSLSAVTTRLAPALDLYREIIREPAFPTEELERLRPRLLAGIAQEKASPFQAALRLLPPLLYGDDHPYGVPMTGSGEETSVAAITREDVLQLYQQNLAPQNSQFLVVGDINMASLLTQLEARFGDWENPNFQARPALPSRPLAQQPRLYLIDKPDAPQTVILAGHLAAPPSDEADLAMQVANSAFGGLFTSRINMNLREDKHWAYGAGSALISTQGQRPVIVYSRVQTDKTVPALREIRRELEDLRSSKPLTAAELDAVVRNKTLSLPGNNESLGQLAGSVAHILSLNLPDIYYNTLVEKLNTMDLAEAQAGAEKLFEPNALTWILIGDVNSEELEKLGWGPVTRLSQ
ncbi:MAG: M16 family metallopeptidase [Oceanococcus sp.]